MSDELSSLHKASSEISPDEAVSEMDMLGTVVHELKTPISAIKSYADLLEQSGGLSEKQERYIKRIHAAVSDMNNLVNDLLDLAWLDGDMALHIAPCNLVDVIRVQMSTLEEYAQEHDVTFHLIGDNNLQPVRADERRLGQVIGNLLSNSIKYSRVGGNVWIRVSRQEDALKVTIRDEGLGIAPEDLPCVFDRFFRSEREEASRIEGSGLGLAIVKAIVRRHNGIVDVSSVLGEGSTFYFAIPL